jgi:hypothetical protein
MSGCSQRLRTGGRGLLLVANAATTPFRSETDTN